MISRKLPIDSVIAGLGYINSKNLVYFNEFRSALYTTHITKLVFEIKPYAIYFVDDAPFIFFFDNQYNESTFKKVSKQIWNAQIPIAIFCDSQNVKIYNGTALDMDTYTLEKATELSLSDCSIATDFSYMEITSPLFWAKYEKTYSADKLNKFLLSNITYLTNELKNTYKVNFATKLVLRLIFIRFLIDRGVDLAYQNFTSDVEQAQGELLNCLRDKNSIYKLFQYLKSKFNGNLFDLGDEISSPELNQDVFDLLTDFLAGTIDMNCGQLSLFSMYDFNIIPVELISNIYEILLGRETRENDNAFYTPNYLVEYILDKTIGGHLKKHSKYTILDPACGSGVFLVDSYRRIVEENLQGQMYCEDDDMLKSLLIDNVFGIDINEEAIDVTIFSLYLTVLDYKDPKSLSTFTLPNLKGTNLFISDFFDEEKLSTLKDISFDFIIGNPPWGNVKTGLHLKYCNDNGYKDKQQNNEICRSFIFRAKDFSNSNTVCCFILHSKLLYNQKQPSKKFRNFLLERTKIHNIVELSSVRKLVFENADAPAVIISFSYSGDDNLGNIIEYISLKPNIFFKLFNIIMIEKNDFKHIQQSTLYKNDWAWKTIVYGFSQDLQLIMKLQNQFPTISEAVEEQKPAIIKGAGVEYQDGDKLDASHLLNKKLLDSKNGVDHFIVNSNKTTLFTKSKIHRPRDRELFEPPYVLIPTGINCTNYKLRAAYSNDAFVCKKTMYIFKGCEEQKSFFMNLTGLLNSSLYAYLNLMLGTSVGIEREQRFMGEVLQYPYIFLQEVSEKVDYIHTEKSKSLPLKFVDLETVVKNLDRLVLQGFGLENNVFIDYAINIQIPELTNTNPEDVYRKVSSKDLLQYSKCFEKQFNAIYSRTGKHIKINLYQNVLNKFSILELFVFDGKSECSTEFIENIDENKELLTKFCVFSYNDKFHQQKDVIYFRENSFFIIKPNCYKYWHPAIAQIDLSDIIEQLMDNSGGER
ncbi:SAM-dependent methyltransferase [Acetobacterium wieringae]|uniref:site-specific DNA-methyltransferase (adenine-specific) n=1 Tax=Acetobacterium wieringae TaxID=52694 RepID=A0ABY6H9H2_9FIRM|nr:SAM-dependent methyltransferase [Acetobacterium wieringae]UYO61132.1 SAM-dependent methyltransferase [Acetobacterium wieringae]